MDIPFWMLAALAAGVCGGIGALVGWLLQSRGYKWGRWLSIIGVGLGIGIVQSEAFDESFKRLTWTDDQTARVLNDVSPEVYAYLAEAFPEDYADMVEASTEIVRNASLRGSVAQRSAELMQALRHKYASFVRFAGEEELTTLMSEQIALYERLQNDDPATCAKVAIEGPISLVDTDLMSTYHPILQKQVVALFQAIRSGMDTPVARRTSTDADWGDITAHMLEANVPESYFQAMTTLDTANLETCPALVALLRAMQMTQTEGGQALRAEYLADTSAS